MVTCALVVKQQSSLTSGSMTLNLLAFNHFFFETLVLHCPLVDGSVEQLLTENSGAFQDTDVYGDTGTHQNLIQIDIQESEDAGRECRSLVFLVARSDLGLVLRHRVLRLFLLWLVLLLLVLCAIIEKKRSVFIFYFVRRRLIHSLCFFWLVLGSFFRLLCFLSQEE